MYDAIIIGAGVTGCAIARELSRYQLNILVLEKEEDVCCGTSKANSAIIHAGHDAKPGSLKARFNVRGNELMDQLSADLDFPFTRNGSLVLCFEESQIPELEELADRGRKNGVPGLSIVTGEDIKSLEPALSDNVKAVLVCPTGGIVCPFLMTIALAENAAVNGVSFRFDTTVKTLSRNASDGHWNVLTAAGDTFEARCIINAAGVYADELHNQVSARKLHITPRRGDYCLLDKTTGSFARHTVFQLPGKYGKGVLVSPTVHGNTIVGPTAIDIDDREGTNTTAEGLNDLIEKAGATVEHLPIRQTITSFAGLRAHEARHDFFIGEIAPGFVDCAAIESPGLSSAPAIGAMVADIVRDSLHLKENPAFDPTRKGILDPKTLDFAARAELIKQNPAYGQIICRCESVTEGEIVDAIHRVPGARSLDGVKRRTRAGMGRCQAGFCSPRVMEILARELGVDQSEITKSGGDSKIIVGTNKDTF